MTVTEKQSEWLKKNTEYSAVKSSTVSLYDWFDQGWLWESGKFSVDDGRTLFGGTERAVRVGKKYMIT